MRGIMMAAIGGHGWPLKTLKSQLLWAWSLMFNHLAQ